MDKNKPPRWRDMVAAMPRLTAEQVTAIHDILDYHLARLVYDNPPVDEAHYLIQQDIDSMKATP